MYENLFFFWLGGAFLYFSDEINYCKHVRQPLWSIIPCSLFWPIAACVDWISKEDCDNDDE